MILILLLAWFDVIAGGDGVAIASDSDCPSATAIHRALRDLPHPRLLAAAAAVTADEDEVTVELSAAGRSAQALRRLPLEVDCTRRAETVALVIISWADAGASEPPPAPAVDLVFPFDDDLVLPFADVRTSDPPRFEMGAGALAAMDSYGASPALRLELSRAQPQGGFGWRAGAVVPGARAMNGLAGTSSYTRVSVSASALAGATSESIRTEADIGPVLGLGWASGRSFAINRTDAGLLAGGTVGARLGLRISDTLTTWLEARAILWFTRQYVVVDRGPSTTINGHLPQSEAHVGIGVSVALPRKGAFR